MARRSRSRRIADLVSKMANEATTASSGERIDFKPDGTNIAGQFESAELNVHNAVRVGRTLNDDNQWVYEGSGSLIAYGAPVGVYDGSSPVSYTRIRADDSSDPDGGPIYVATKDVYDQTKDSTAAAAGFMGAFQVERDGGLWSWQSYGAGRMRFDDDGTTAVYRAADNSLTAYSGTGNEQADTTYAGYTQIAAREAANGDDVFLSYSDGSHRIEFDASGNGRFDGGADISAADYAEYFEWADGNPDNEDRRGKAVVLVDNGMIRLATPEDADDDYLGIVSVEPGVVGDSAWSEWTGAWKRDKFGQKVMEDYQLICWGKYDDVTKSYDVQVSPEVAAEMEVPEDAVTITKQRQARSEAYDPEREYIPRKDRPEWQAIGMLGKLPLLKGSPVKSTWRKLFDLNDEVEMWLVR
jgi:hypothetical protein